VKKSESEQGFSREYWEENYSSPEDMDCIGNARQHAKYLKSFLEIEYVDVNSIIDFGFGLGHLFEEMLQEFLPYKAYGIEPSRYVFDQVAERKIKPVGSMKLKLENINLTTWAKSQKEKSKIFDLGICTSVFQYLRKEELEFVIPIIAKKVKYLYLTVPTDKELKRQVSDLEFYDRFAMRRSRSFYQKILKRDFTFVSSRFLESKKHFDEESTNFTDLLFRF
jgi:hypothetical protein